MNEMRALVEAFDAAVSRGDRCAMATVVSVEGSSYRRPGVRMLVTERGETTGTISAGCLEGDVAERAKIVLRTGESTLIEYDTSSTGDDDAWGFGLGCGGVIRVLVEPLERDSLYVDALRRASTLQPDAMAVTVATVYWRAPSSADVESIPIGARICVDADGSDRQSGLSDRVASALVRATTEQPPQDLSSGTRSIVLDGVATSVFVEELVPPVPLLIFGAGVDVLPVVDLARSLGWRTEVIDPQARPATHVRFSSADRVTLARVEDLATQLDVTARTMALVMSHSYANDREMLRHLLASPARYIGVMGPRHRTERMLTEIAAAGDARLFDDASMARLHAPVGLDIGASTPADIALSIVAEIRAVLDSRQGGMLRERQRGIHEDGSSPRSPDTNSVMSGRHLARSQRSMTMRITHACAFPADLRSLR